MPECSVKQFPTRMRAASISPGYSPCGHSSFDQAFVGSRKEIVALAVAVILIIGRFNGLDIGGFEPEFANVEYFRWTAEGKLEVSFAHGLAQSMEDKVLPRRVVRRPREIRRLAVKTERELFAALG